MKTGAASGREEGKVFENIFERQARSCGLLPIRNLLTARFIGKGRVRLLKSELDFRLINQQGRVAFVDCKSFQPEAFSYSVIDAKQLEKAVLYNNWRVPAGFCVWFRDPDVISYFPGWEIFQAGPGSTFRASDGYVLGSYQKFDLKLIYDVKMRLRNFA